MSARETKSQNNFGPPSPCPCWTSFTEDGARALAERYEPGRKIRLKGDVTERVSFPVDSQSVLY
jgi:hypothetical protein